MQHHYFSLVTNDVKKLSEFYKTVLQAETCGINDLENYVELFIDAFVFCIESLTSVEGRIRRPFNAFSEGSVIVEFEVDNADEEHSRLKNLGIVPFTEPFDNPWGRRNFHFYDPDGNIVCIFADISK